MFKSETRRETHPLPPPRPILISRRTAGCNCMASVIKVCSLQRESRLGPVGTRVKVGNDEGDGGHKSAQGEGREKKGEREGGEESGEGVVGGGILLYTVCIITLRCTCELFPPRLTRPIHNRVTAVKVLPVIAAGAPPSWPNIVPTPDSPPPPPWQDTYCPAPRQGEKGSSRSDTFTASFAS